MTTLITPGDQPDDPPIVRGWIELRRLICAIIGHNWRGYIVCRRCGLTDF